MRFGTPRPGDVLSTRSGGARCRAACIVRDGGGDLHLVSSSYALEAEASRDIYCAGREVGRLPERASRSATAGAGDLVGLVRLPARPALPDGLPAQLVQDPCEAYGLEVVLAGIPWRGRVVATDARLHLEGRLLEEALTCDGLLEAAFEGGTDEFDPDQAGTLVMDATGAALGILVGGAPRRAIIAPLAPFLAERGLALAPPSETLAGAVARGEDGIMAVLRSVSAGAADLRSELMAPLPAEAADVEYDEAGA